MKRNTRVLGPLFPQQFASQVDAPVGAEIFTSRADAIGRLERGQSAVFIAGTPTLRAAVRGSAYALGRSQNGIGRRFRCKRRAIEVEGTVLDAVEVERVS